MPVLDDIRHERFVHALLKGKTQGEAYIDAGYTAKSLAVASAGATRLLKDVKIGARLDELRENVKEKAVLDRAWVVGRLMKNAQIAMGELAIKQKVNTKDGVSEMELTDRDGSVANKSLELLGKTAELRLWVEQVEHGEVGDFDNMSIDDVRAFIRERTSALGVGAKALGVPRGERDSRGKPN